MEEDLLQTVCEIILYVCERPVLFRSKPDGLLFGVFRCAARCWLTGRYCGSGALTLFFLRQNVHLSWGW